MFEIREIDEGNREKIVAFIVENWGSTIMVSRGKVHHMEKLPGYMALRDDRVIGLITYNIENNGCEIVSLDSLEENRGVGSTLVNKVIERAEELDCSRVWLITTNDNTRAMGFYQKRGFNMKALYLNAVVEARKIKPEIPQYGYNDIPILHEIEFEKVLK